MVGYHPHSSLLFYFQVSIRGGHGGHGGHALRIHRDPRPVHEDAAQALRRSVRDSPGLWRHSNGSELPRLRDFWRVVSPHFFHFSHSALRGRAGTRDWPSDGAGARLGARWLFRPLCKKCRQPAILILLVSPHLFHSAAGAQWGRAGVGEGGSSDAERSKRSGNGRVERGAGSEVPNQPRCGSRDTHAPRAGRVWGAARCASRGQG